MIRRGNVGDRRETRKGEANAGIKIIVRNIKSTIPDAKIVECSLGPIFRGVQVLSKRCWCHVIKRRASFVRHRLESWSFDKS